MRGKDVKRVFLNFLPYECAAAEEYFEAMAEKGWMLQSVKGPIVKFKRMLPVKVKYSVDVLPKVSAFDHSNSDVALEYREYCQAAGWNYVCEKGKIQIFCAEESEKTISIHTDDNEKFNTVLKASFFDIGNQLFLLMLFLFNLYIQLFMGDIRYSLASNLSIISITSMIIALLITSTELFSFLQWCVKARSQIKVGTHMTYNNYKQLKQKNMLKAAFLIIILLLLSISSIADYQDKGKVDVFFIAAMLIPIVIMVVISRLIDMKRYSKKTNMAITIGGIVVSSYLVLSFIGSVALRNSIDVQQSGAKTQNTALSLVDFGYKERTDRSPFISKDKSILAEKVYYSSNNDGVALNYSVLRSRYSWVIRATEKRLINRFYKYGIALSLEDTNLPDNMRVYTDEKKRTYILVSGEKIADISKELKNIDNDEFLDKAYKKLFN